MKKSSLNPRYILASASPRRKDILRQSGFKFETVPSTVRETWQESEPPSRLVKRLAHLKAASVARRFKKQDHPCYVIGADTIVVLGRRIFGKPKSLIQAQEMLLCLSGKTHRVYTGTAVIHAQSGQSFLAHDYSKVTVKKLTPEFALKVGQKHRDKSGSYACQDKTHNIVAKIEGEWQTVAGLSMRRLRSLLKLHKIKKRGRIF